MMFSVIAGVFFAAIFFNPYDPLVYAVYMVILLSILISTAVFIRSTANLVSFRNALDPSDYAGAPRVLWVLSIPPVIAQLALVSHFGGLVEFLIAAKWGTREFWGMGPLKTIISTIYPLNLLYFSYFLISARSLDKKNVSRKSFFLHCAVTLGMSVLLLSRGTLLTHIVFMVFIYHLLVRPVRIHRLVCLAALALIVAGAYGAIRETFSINENDGISLIKEGEFGSRFKTEWMEFGTFPLATVIANENNVQPALGLTYATVATNFIPRSLWPEKPSPGGTVFTKQYVPGMYDEFSDYTTGLFPEAIMNFGVVIGIIFGGITLVSIIVFLVRFGGWASNVYAYLLWFGPLYLTGEFTNNTIVLIVKVLTVVVGVGFLRSFCRVGVRASSAN
jgi:hypothetical protein